jgi:CheY-like chemotaxis protein
MSKKLLLADDSITIQKVIQITFAHEDYELTITDNGDAALVKAQEIKPDLIMSDVYMPGKNGYELTSAIKQDPALSHVPVLLLAGSFEPFDEDKARSCNADAWIEKPFESQNLIDKVAELLSSAPEAPAAPAPVAEPELVAEPEPAVTLEPEAVEEAAVEEPPLAAFDETTATVPEVAAAPEDPFGDISFEEETPAPEPQPVAAADDWSDVAAEPVAEEPVVEDAFAVAEPVAEVEEDFAFAEAEPLPVADFAEVEEAPVAEAELDVFDMGDEDIMPLGDDDILGEEDLEPVMPEQTLAAWSRSDAAEDVFAEPLAEPPAVEDEDVFADEEPVAEVAETFTAPAVEEVVPFAEEPVVEEAPVIEEPAAEVAPAFVEPASVEEEPAAVVAEPEPATVDVEAKASAMGEDEIEAIIERVVGKVVEKLAGSILERVAWEVVPDLAENLIREEIRKIKDTAA